MELPAVSEGIRLNRMSKADIHTETASAMRYTDTGFLCQNKRNGQDCSASLQYIINAQRCSLQYRQLTLIEFMLHSFKNTKIKI
jgi:hypothetical protein